MFSWGKKKKPEEKYAKQLAKLEAKGYTDRKKNIAQLKMYNGKVDLVLMDYETVDKPASGSPSVKSSLSLSSLQRNKLTLSPSPNRKKKPKKPPP